MRSQWLTTPLLAACLVFAAALSVETRNDLYFGGKHDSASSKLGLMKRTVDSRTTGALNSGCTNQPSSRQCWYGDFDILTDVDKAWPSTGRNIYVRSTMPRLLRLADIPEYTLIIRNTTCNPDGHGSRTCLLINDQYPGPTLQAGQSIVVTFHKISCLQH